MSDEALRALERDAAADPTRTLEWARALERAGRTDEAWVALCRGVDQPEVRAELAPRPVWTHPTGPGRTCFLDVPPLRQAPRTRWAAPVVGGDRLLASPLGIVVLEGHTSRPTAVLDPRDGRPRWTPDQFSRDAWLDGDLLLAHRRLEELHAWRLWADGEGAPPSIGHVRLSGAPERIELSVAGGALGLLARPLDAPTVDPQHGHVEAQMVGRAGVVAARVGGARAIVVDERAPGAFILVGHSDEPWQVWARDLGRHGAEPVAGARWTRQGRFGALDGQGVVVLHDSTAWLLDLDGRERWSFPRSQDVVALGPRHLVLGPHRAARRFRPHGEWVVRVHERATGRMVADVPLQDTRVRGCLVRDLLVLPGADDTLAAWTLDGAPVWRVQVGVVRDLAPLPGALVVLLDDRRVVCLEEGPTAP